MSTPLGLAVKTYRNTATIASPSMTEMTNIRDEQLGMTASEADASTRAGGGWEQILIALKTGTWSFVMNWDDDASSTAGLDLAAIHNAFINKTSLDVCHSDGTLVSDLVTAQTADIQYFRASWVVTDFSLNRNLTEVVSVDVTMKIAPDQTPAWVTTS